MKKRISLLSLCLGLFIAACTDSSGFEDLQNFSEKEVMPRAAGDGIYDVLGYGYDITLGRSFCSSTGFRCRSIY